MRPRHWMLLRSADRRGRRGQGVAEFALIAPVLLLMLLITLDFGRLYLSYVTLNNVVRVAANYGALAPGAFTGTPDTTTYDAVVGRESAGLNCDLRAVGPYNPPIPTYPSGTQLGGTSVAAMTCDFSLLTPLIGTFFGGSLPISAQAEFPIRTGAVANIGGSTGIVPPGSPVAAFSFVGVTGGTVNGSGNVTGMPPLTVNVSDTSSNAQTWDWDWGDGSTHETIPAPPAHTYTSAGTFSVTLTITNSQGTSQLTRTVTTTSSPTPPPVAGFYGTPVGSAPQAQGGGAGGTAITGSQPLVVDFTNTSTGASAYSWSFGDGSSPSTQTSPQHTYSNLGVFTVTMTITTPAGGGAFTRNAYVTVGCVGPTFAGTLTSAAQSTWSGAHFSGTITYQPSTANGNSNTSTTPPNPAKTITEQVGLTGGQWVPPNDPHGNNPWCGSDIKLRYTP